MNLLLRFSVRIILITNISQERIEGKIVETEAMASGGENSRLILPPIPKGPVYLVCQENFPRNDGENTTEGRNGRKHRSHPVSCTRRKYENHERPMDDDELYAMGYEPSWSQRHLPRSTGLKESTIDDSFFFLCNVDDRLGQKGDFPYNEPCSHLGSRSHVYETSEDGRNREIRSRKITKKSLSPFADQIRQSDNEPLGATCKPTQPANTEGSSSHKEPVTMPNNILSSGDVNVQPSYAIPTKIEVEAKKRAEDRKHKRIRSAPLSHDSQSIRGKVEEHLQESGQKRDPRAGTVNSMDKRNRSLHRPLQGSRSLPFRSRRVGVCEDPNNRERFQQEQRGLQTTPETGGENTETTDRVQHEDTTQRDRAASDTWSLPARPRRHGLCDVTDAAASERMKARVLYKRFAKNVSQKEMEDIYNTS